MSESFMDNPLFARCQSDPVSKAELEARTRPGQTACILARMEAMLDYYKRVPTEKQKREKNKQNNAENIDPGEKNEVPLCVETPAGEVIGTGKIIKTEKGLYWCFTTAAGAYLKKNKKVNLRIIIDRLHTDFIPTSYRHHPLRELGER
jgi:hypothetical protein